MQFPLSQIASGEKNHSIAVQVRIVGCNYHSATLQIRLIIRVVLQAHCFSVAGACLALGIKFAGTKDTVAAETLVRFVHYFLTEKYKFVFPGKDDEIVENCMAACALSLSVVLAGSGDLKTFKLLRSKFRFKASKLLSTYIIAMFHDVSLIFLFEQVF